jgi:beta-lactamase class D
VNRHEQHLRQTRSKVKRILTIEAGRLYRVYDKSGRMVACSEARPFVRTDIRSTWNIGGWWITAEGTHIDFPGWRVEAVES